MNKFFIIFPILSVHENVRRRGVDFGNEQSSTSGRTPGRRISVAHHGHIHEPINEPTVYDDNPIRMSVVSCLGPSSLAFTGR
jgi:hypothetical protein